MSRLDQRPDIIEAREWLTANIRTTQDAPKLAEMVDRVSICFDQTGATSSAVRNAICHYHGQTQWTPAILAAEEILRRRYGRLWNYAGD